MSPDLIDLNYRKTICESVIEQSARTWNLLRVSSRIHLSISEETITDLNLLELQVKHPTEIRTQKFSKQKEALEGADWELWLTSGGSWLGFRVQAKKLDRDSLEYPELGHVVKSSGKRQVDLLIEHAVNSSDKIKRIPLYVFYNYWKKNRFNPSWLCGSYSFSYEMLGCGMAYAEHVRNILNGHSNRLKDVSEVMYPLSCLVCCNGYSQDVLPKRARTFVTNAFGRLAQDRFPAEYLANMDFLTEKPPTYVSRIADGEGLSDENWSEIPVTRVTVINEKVAEKSG